MTLTAIFKESYMQKSNGYNLENYNGLVFGYC